MTDSQVNKRRDEKKKKKTHITCNQPTTDFDRWQQGLGPSRIRDQERRNQATERGFESICGFAVPPRGKGRRAWKVRKRREMRRREIAIDLAIWLRRNGADLFSLFFFPLGRFPHFFVFPLECFPLFCYMWTVWSVGSFEQSDGWDESLLIMVRTVLTRPFPFQ